MAREIEAYGASARIRSPFAVVGLNVLTLGIYGAVWYYRVNAELRDFGDAYRDRALADSRPRHSLLAMVPGVLLVVPPLVSLAGFVGRMRRAQRYGRSELASGWLVAVLTLTLVFFPAIPGYVQSTLNELWGRYAATDATPSVGRAPDELSEEDLAGAPAPRAAEVVA